MGIHIHINQGGGGGTPAELAVSTTYTELKALRDGANLVPGTWYRITDYLCSTSQQDTQAAQHQFDIIVLALDESHLSEDAFAAHHDGDTYFADNKLEAWKLKYCLDNDTERFAWAQGESGGGESEFFVEYEDDGKTMRLQRTAMVDGKDPYWVYGEEYQLYSSADPKVGDTLYSDSSLTESSGFVISNIEEIEPEPVQEGNGVVYYMKDEFGNECPYDFKNIMYERSGIMVYTFASINNGTVTDASMSFDYIVNDGTGSGAGGNVIKELVIGARQLNNNVIMNNEGDLACFGNIFEENCSNNTLSHQCNMNKFSQYCSNNQFSQGCISNQFSQNCQGNTFSQDCQSNSFSQYCSYNQFSQGCWYNQFSQYCQGNSFSQGCWYNQFSQYCNYNQFSQGCWYNQFSQSCSYNQFSQGCSYNEFSQGCFEVILPDNSHYFRLQPYVHSIEVVATGNEGSPENVHILSGVAGDKGSSLTVTIAKGAAYTQMVGKDTNGTMHVWNPADAAS